MSESESHYSSQSYYGKVKRHSLRHYFRTAWHSFKDDIKGVSIGSNKVRDYFLELIFPNTKNRIRLFLKTCILFSMHRLLEFCLNSREVKISEIFFSGMICSVTILIYTSTIKNFKTKRYVSFYTVIIMTMMLMVIYMKNIQNSNLLTEITPVVQMTLMFYCVHLVDFDITLTLCLAVTYVYIRGESIQENTKGYFNIQGTFLADLGATSPTDKFISLKRFDSHSMQELRFVGILMLWILLNLTGTYLYAMNNLRQLSAFKQIGQNVLIRHNIVARKEEAMVWIASIMPSSIIPDYMKFQKDLEKLYKGKGKSKHEMHSEILRVFCRSYTEVTILFADIVGFTDMSSNKTANELVLLLNDLFNRFDICCYDTGCEKIGTLGDCYYCVAGCPTPRTDHALCCVRMGLSTCLIIQEFNRDHSENVNMRVGIHTGRVNVAVIGEVRFHFNVYSYDVIIANDMESTGQPGKVHITESTYAKVKSVYSCDVGRDYEIKNEKDSSPKHVLKTYFVRGLRGTIRKGTFTPELQTGLKSKANLNIINPDNIVIDKSSITSSEDIHITRIGINKLGLHGHDNEKDFDKALINSMRDDPEHHSDLFKIPPLHPITLQFASEDVERAYRDQILHEHGKLTIESIRLAPLLDCSASAIYAISYLIACYLITIPKQKVEVFNFDYRFWMTVGTASLCVSLTIPLVADLFRKKNAFIRFHRTFRMRNIRMLIFSLIPLTILILNQEGTCEVEEETGDNNATKYFAHDYIVHYGANKSRLCIYGLISSLLVMSGSSWINIATVFAKAIIFIAIQLTDNCYIPKESNSTYGCNVFHKDVYNEEYNFQKHVFILKYTLNIALTAILIAILVRANEFNLRLCFYSTYVADSKRKEEEEASQRTQNLLYNIVPKYVMAQLRQRGANLKNFSYAVAVPNAGVTFACISNFFSTFYREDYKGGESSLALLNKVICLFDEGIKEFDNVEKIKSVNACYMVAAGLNLQAVGMNIDANAHLYDLMSFSFHMLEIIKLFNDRWIIGEDKFKLKIGFNIGPVVAGIIGTTKPMYDIWGDTVNVSSRMYSTSRPGVIQCPYTVRMRLREKFVFRRRGYVNVKGKGRMKTYLCVSQKMESEADAH